MWGGTANVVGSGRFACTSEHGQGDGSRTAGGGACHPENAAGRMGMRCACPWNPSSQRGVPIHRSPPFQTPPLPLSNAPRTANLFDRLRHYRPGITDPAQRFPTSPMRRAGRVGMRCARPWNPSSRHVRVIHRSPLFQAPPLPLSSTPRTAQLFHRLRRDRPGITDPTQRVPTSPMRRAGRVGTRCARPWNPSSRHVRVIHRSPPFQAPPPSAVEHPKDGAPFSSPAGSTDPESRTRHSGSLPSRCAVQGG